MNARQIQALTAIGTDVTTALHRMGNDESIFQFCLETFQTDQTIRQLNDAVNRGAWKDAFRAAHALKGMTGNMGFMPLMQCVSVLTELLRAEEVDGIDAPLAQVNRCYDQMLEAIAQYFALATP